MLGWIFRTVSAHKTSNLGLYIAETILVYAGPPIYAAAEYNILGRLMHYLPMHAPLNPNLVTYFFIYLGILVEALTGAGAGRIARADPGSERYLGGGKIIAASIVLQGAIECIFMGTVALVHYRCSKAGMMSKNVKIICITLYGTSTLIILRCVFRAVEAFTTYTKGCSGVYCGSIANNEWYLYAFEAAPMVLYTLWLNLMHPGRFLPANNKRYLDTDGETERMGPGWDDTRPIWLKAVDPLNLQNALRARRAFWLNPREYPVCEFDSFALGTASNHGRKKDTEG
jgi:RTA1 like protein